MSTPFKINDKKRSAISLCIATALGLGYSANTLAQETEEELKSWMTIRESSKFGISQLNRENED